MINELKSLTMVVNISTGISHLSDRKQTIISFKRLKPKRIDYDPNKISNWLVKNGWRTYHVDNIKKTAKMIKEG